MSNACTRYQIEQFAKHHYRKLISAKGSLPSPRQAVRHLTNRVDPIEKFQFTCTNYKLLGKLVEIYQKPLPAGQTKSKKKRKIRQMSSVVPRGSLKSSFGEREEEMRVQKQNDNLLQRIVTVKPTIGQDWLSRDNTLKKYRALTRKRSTNAPHQTFYEAFRELKIDDKKKSRRRRIRSATANKATLQLKKH